MSNCKKRYKKIREIKFSEVRGLKNCLFDCFREPKIWLLDVFRLEESAKLKYRIFLPFWFYVKSISRIFRPRKTVIMMVLNALNLEFGQFQPWKTVEIHQNRNSKSVKWSKMAVFDVDNLREINFTDLEVRKPVILTVSAALNPDLRQF